MPGMHHGRLELARDRQVNIFWGVNGDQPWTGLERAAGGQDGRSMIPEAASKDGQMTESSLMAIDRARRRESGEVIAQGPLHFAGGRIRHQANVRFNLKTADV